MGTRSLCWGKERFYIRISTIPIKQRLLQGDSLEKTLVMAAIMAHEGAAASGLGLEGVTASGIGTDELVFASNKDLVTNHLDKGTYNYVDGNVFTSIPLIGGHWNYDMAPYNAQMKGERLKLAVNWDYLFRGNSHTWKNNRE